MNVRWMVTGWLMAVGILGGVALRWSTVGTPVLIALVGVIGMVLAVPLMVLLVSAWRSRSRLLRLATVGVLLVYLITFASVQAVVGCGSATAEDDLVVFHHNVYTNEGDPVRVAASTLASGADVVVLMEVWPEFVDELGRQPGMEAYGYRSSEPAYGPTGAAVWSRWPLADAAMLTVGRRPMLSMTVQAPQGPFTLWAVHTSAPVEQSEIDDWQTQLSYLATIDRSRPTVIAGDFNATIDHAQFRSLLEAGWTDVHTPKGCGFDQTWPTSRGTGIALMRLDHVLVTDHFEVLGLELGDPNGSDHRSLATTLRLRASDEASEEPKAPGPDLGPLR